MKNTTKNITRLAAAGLIAAATLLTPSASATTMIRLTVEEMTVRATDVLVGTVTRVESHWTDDHAQILTYVTVADTETLKGELHGQVTFVQLGGQVDDRLMLVVGAPQFEVNQRVCVFLSQMATRQRLAVNTDRWLMGLSQGVWLMTEDQNGVPLAVVESASMCGVTRPGVTVETILEPNSLKSRIRATVADPTRVNAVTAAKNAAQAQPAQPTEPTPAQHAPSQKGGN